MTDQAGAIGASPPSQRRATIVRLDPELQRELRELSFDRRVRGKEPYTINAIVTAAIDQYLGRARRARALNEMKGKG